LRRQRDDLDAYIKVETDPGAINIQERIELKFPSFSTPRMKSYDRQTPGPGSYTISIKNDQKLGKMLDSKKKPIDCRKMDRF